ncbi:hypothetical protein [Defluviimonas salinarum]|uniref:Uncharacterized protein n=1 Tax=Defluviimonas salinarum TaxID=2992147 RepID=A0ABT3J5P8_9RHOB|nr:hypothetical protein [Defluviimonas salinarum]MCW3783019.1 hypothetical protein [Defluviimonas salinarum]
MTAPAELALKFAAEIALAARSFEDPGEFLQAVHAEFQKIPHAPVAFLPATLDSMNWLIFDAPGNLGPEEKQRLLCEAAQSALMYADELGEAQNDAVVQAFGIDLECDDEDLEP